MQRNLLSVLIAGLFAAAPAGAQDLGKLWATQGSITLGPIITDIDSRDASKAEQYRDLSDGALSAILLRGRGPTGKRRTPVRYPQRRTPRRPATAP